MRFSERTNWNTEESELAHALRERRTAGLPVYDLSNANPTRCGFNYDQGLLGALQNPQALDYDPDPKGMRSARKAVAAYYADHNASVDPDNILLTTSTSEAYSYLFRLLCDSGSEILVPQPSYPLFDFLATLDDIRLIFAPLVYDHGWQMDSEGFRRVLTPATRAIILVHPNNPTGHFTKTWEIAELASLCLQHNLALIIDEVFLDYFLTDEVESFAKGVDGVNCFVVSGLSKIAALPQMKAAWIIATGPDERQSMQRLEVIADTFLSMNAPIQCALPAWLENRKGIQSQILMRLKANLAGLDRQLATQSLIHRLEVEGGWYAVLRIPAYRSDTESALRLLSEGLWAHPGSFFGMQERGWFVVSLLTPVDEFNNGIAVLIDHFAKNQKGYKSEIQG
jgi:aspartate/methionine/tyrosine aminotransferase